MLDSATHWYTMGVNQWYIMGVNPWYIMGVNPWYIMGVNPWYIIACKLTNVARLWPNHVTDQGNAPPWQENT